MTDQFKKLSKHEWELLVEAIPLIGILIAGADGEIDEEEMDWSKKITHIRSYKMKGSVKSYYEEVDRDFETKLMHYSEVLPSGVEERTEIISEKLRHLNPILAKLDSDLSYKLYKGFLSFADHVAKASGGVMGFFAVNKEEAKLLTLPMLNPIYFDGTEEE
ncbi:MAG: hypothetical protein IPK35_10495 [Saprospiraceae bacterium]|jgi:hypothetical protein|nr:hypothetical protein [Saprospiraceae bacterium]